MKNKIRALIVDDERLARNALKNKLEHFNEITVVGEADSVNTAVSAIKELQPDLLFLDIQLYNETGFDILNNIDYTGKIIFVTAYDEYAIRAFEINAVDYLLKPISVERLNNAISRLDKPKPVKIQNKYNYNDRILVGKGNKMIFVELKSIICISASGDYSSIKTADNTTYLVSKSMNEWENRLPENNFFRIHRSTIINIEFVEKTEKWVNYTSLVYLKGIDEPFKLSRSNMKKFKERYF